MVIEVHPDLTDMSPTDYSQYDYHEANHVRIGETGDNSTPFDTFI